MSMKRVVAALAAGLLVACGTAALAFRERGRGHGSDDAAEHGVAAAAPAEAAAPADKAKALFEAKCSICHPTSRALAQRKDEAGWTATVKRMQQSNGCPITDGEAAEIAAYLTRIRGVQKGP